jgi:hypothetical protein
VLSYAGNLSTVVSFKTHEQPRTHCPRTKHATSAFIQRLLLHGGSLPALWLPKTDLKHLVHCASITPVWLALRWYRFEYCPTIGYPDSDLNGQFCRPFRKMLREYFDLFTTIIEYTRYLGIVPAALTPSVLVQVQFPLRQAEYTRCIRTVPLLAHTHAIFPLPRYNAWCAYFEYLFKVQFLLCFVFAPIFWNSTKFPNSWIELRIR